MKMELNKKNIELLESLRKQFEGIIVGIDNYSYDKLIMMLHLGFSEKALMEVNENGNMCIM